MPRDYVRTRPRSNTTPTRGTPPQPKRSGSSGFVWLLAGIFIGLIIAGVFYIKNHASQLQSQALSAPAPAPTETSLEPPTQTNSTALSPNASKNQNTQKENITQKSAAKTDSANKNNNAAQPSQSSSAKKSPQSLQTQFDFYNVLPGKNVVGPSGDEDATALNPTLSSPSASSTSASPSSSTSKNAVSSPQTTVQDENDTDDNANNDTDTDADANTNTDADAASAKSSVPSSTQASTPRTAKTPPSSTSIASTSSSGPSAASHHYILQAGVFSQYTDADNLKAQLVLLGFEAKTSSLTKNGKSLTRVYIGPFHSADEAKSIQSQLKENAISAKLLKSAE